MHVSLESLSKRYGPVTALEDVTLEIREGEFLGLVGPNGSGKSTLLKLLLGLIRPTSGTLRIDGREPDPTQWKRIRREIGYMPEQVLFYDHLTGEETLSFLGQLKGVSGEAVKAVLEQVDLAREADRKVREYSKGMRQRLNLAQALLGEPRMLILDEPTSGLDPVAVREFYCFLESYRRQRPVTVLFSTHILAEIEDRIDRVVILQGGRLRALGALSELHQRLRLPLRLSLVLRAQDPGLEEALAREGAYDLAYRNGELQAHAPAECKTRLLALLLERRENIQDFSITEPSLEEVFFGIQRE